MLPLFICKDCFLRAFSKKWVILILAIVLLLSTTCGTVFIKTPYFFEYHLRICDRFLDRVCYSDRNVILIFFERTGGCALLVALALAGGFHPVCLLLPLAVLVYRSYTFGGTLAILFSVYEFPGAVVALLLYIPIHLLTDGLLLIAAGLSFSRAFRFSFCAGELRELLSDFLVLLLLCALVCLAEMILLLVLFHPLGNLL